ncbi:unnamed protein product [Prunus armeniaca]
MVSKAIRNFTLPSQEQKPNGNKLEAEEGQQEFEAGEGEQVCQVFMSNNQIKLRLQSKLDLLEEQSLGQEEGVKTLMCEHYVRTPLDLI